jgi:simple sugar transport system permease protein
MKTATAKPGRLGLNGDLIQLVLITGVIFIAMSLIAPDKFLTLYNFESISFMFPEIGLLSIAMMIAMLTGGIDLSVIGIANMSSILAGVFFARFMGANPDLPPHQQMAYVACGVALALVIGALCGVLNGFLITKVRITPILATIGTGQLFTGIALVITGGPAITGFPAYWAEIGSGTVGHIAIPFLVFIVVAGAIAFLLSKTVFGINLMLIGTNAKAALFAGLKREKMVWLSYVMTGTLASMAGILLSARTNAAKSDYGVSYLLQSVLIAVLGGTNPAGGRGGVLGVFIAVLALMFLSSGFQIMRFSIHLIDFIWGAFLVGVIILNTVLEQRRGRQHAHGKH